MDAASSSGFCVSCFRAELREQHLRMAYEDPSLEMVISAMWARVSGWTALRAESVSGHPGPRSASIATNPDLAALPTGRGTRFSGRPR